MFDEVKRSGVGGDPYSAEIYNTDKTVYLPKSFTTLKLGKGVKRLPRYFMTNITSVKTVYYAGSTIEWNEVQTSYRNYGGCVEKVICSDDTINYKP